MYRILYSIGIMCYGTAIRLAGGFNGKAREWWEGRKSLFARIEEAVDPEDRIIWLHAASLGEAEQVIPVIQELRKYYSQKKILLTFFSPSGMQHFKNEGLADYIFYLPLDTRSNARKFLDTVKPDLAFFVKYEIWPNFFLELQHRNIPHVIAPAVFRPGHFYFTSPHQEFFLPILKSVNRIMVQDERSKDLLERKGIQNVVVVGDSRFDRVLQNTRSTFVDEVLEKFTQNEMVLIGGSTWPSDEQILKKVLDQNPDMKMIIAPHEIKKENIQRVYKLFEGKRSFRYSEKLQDPSGYRVCIIDNIGMLSRLYRYGQLAYIGGAFGKGIHNSLEAAAYGLPLFFGPRHQNFIEPSEMIAKGFAFEIRNFDEMQKHLLHLKNPQQLKEKSIQAKTYVESKAGVVEKMMKEITELL